MKLPKNCSVEAIEKIVDELKTECEKKEIILDGKDVERVDVSFIQLMLAIEKANIKLKISPQSETFAEFLKLYHMKTYLCKD